MPTSIGWTDETWNPGLAGCSDKSAGCTNCYAKTMAHRLAGMPGSKEKYAGTTYMTKGGKVRWTGHLNLIPDDPTLYRPLKWKKPRMVFVNSMTDLFHEKVPFEFVDRVMAVIALTPQHTYQVLTKRSERMQEYFTNRQCLGAGTTKGKDSLSVCWQNAADAMQINNPFTEWDWPGYEIFNRLLREWPLQNLWLGASVEDQAQANKRVPALLNTPAAVRFLSCEPLLGAVDLTHVHFDDLVEINSLTGDHGVKRPHAGRSSNRIQWVIAGGESGHGARPMHPDWVRGLRNQCREHGVPFFFKQWGVWAPGGHINFDRNRVMTTNGKVYSYKTYNHDAMREGISTDDWNMLRPNVMHKSSAKESGNVLDGVRHEEFPRTGGVRGDH